MLSPHHKRAFAKLYVCVCNKPSRNDGNSMEYDSVFRFIVCGSHKGRRRTQTSLMVFGVSALNPANVGIQSVHNYFKPTQYDHFDYL